MAGEHNAVLSRIKTVADMTWWMHFVMRSSVGAFWSRWFGAAGVFARPVVSVSLLPWPDAILGRKLVPVYINVRTALAGISLQ